MLPTPGPGTVSGAAPGAASSAAPTAPPSFPVPGSTSATTPGPSTAKPGGSTAEAESMRRLRKTCAEPYSELDLPPLGNGDKIHPWNELNEKQLRSALQGACKRMPRNAEAHFHLGLMYMRLCDGDEALRAFEHCRQIYNERMEQHKRTPQGVPQQLRARMATLRAHSAQAAHLAAAQNMTREERAKLLEKLQKDLVEATNLDNSQPHIWNALALLHLSEGGFEGARQVLRSIRNSFPEYLDALNNLGLAELALGNSEAAITCFQKVIVVDRHHAEALANYGLVLLRKSIYEAAARAFTGAVQGTHKDSRGLAFAWGGLAIANAAVAKFNEAEKAAIEAEKASDSTHKPRFGLLLTSIRARRVTEELRQGTASDQVAGVQQPMLFGTSPTQNDPNVDDPRQTMDNAVLKLRSLSRDIGTSYASTALGAALRIRHDFSWEETGNRNFGAEAAERLVEALEKDNNDAAAWVQLALLQLGTGRYTSSRDFSLQAAQRNEQLESAWNALAVSSQLNDCAEDSNKAYDRAVDTITENYAAKHGHEDEADAHTEPVQDVITPAVEPNEAMADVPEVSMVGKQALAALYNNIGNLKRQEGNNFAEAQKVYQKSLAVGGENAAVYNNLALLYISADQFDDAERMLEHALKLQPHFECAKSNLLKLNSLQQLQRLQQADEEMNATFIADNIDV